MATVTGLTAERMLEIEAASVVDGLVNQYGELILLKHDASEINAGSVIGPTGAKGDKGDIGNTGATGGTGLTGPQGVPGDKLKIYTAVANDVATATGWVTIGTFLLSTQFADANAFVHILSTNNDAPIMATLRINIKQLSAMGGGSTRCEVFCSNLRNISQDDIKIEIVTANATQTSGKIWVRMNAPFTTLQWVVPYADTNITFADAVAISNVGGEPGGLTGSVKGSLTHGYLIKEHPVGAVVAAGVTSSTEVLMATRSISLQTARQLRVIVQVAARGGTIGSTWRCTARIDGAEILRVADTIGVVATGTYHNAQAGMCLTDQAAGTHSFTLHGSLTGGGGSVDIASNDFSIETTGG